MTSPPTRQPLSFTEDQARENELHIGAVAELIATGEAVAIIGAGISKSAGYWSWSELLIVLRDIAERCQPGFVPPVRAEERPLEYARGIRDHIVSARGVEFFQSEVARLFSVEPRIAQVHIDLLMLPFRGFATTNYDRTLEEAAQACGRAEAPPVPVSTWNASGQRLREALRGITTGSEIRHILHLHGFYDEPATVVLCDDDYEKAYGFTRGSNAQPGSPGGPTKLWTVLVSLLTTRQIVFVGFSLTDPFVAELMERMSGVFWQWREAVHYALMPIEALTAPEDRLRADRLRDALGVQVVFYDSEGDDHAKRDAVVSRIRKSIDDAREKEVKPTSVQISETETQLPAWAVNHNAIERHRIERRGRGT